MKINWRGVTRIVIELKTVVIKVPNPRYQWDHFLKGLIGNIAEKKTWEYNSGKYELGKSYLLCPVVWMSWGGWILVMKKAVPVSREDWEWITIPEHRKHFAGDDTMSNYGWYLGRLVKLDYGSLDSWPSDYVKRQGIYDKDRDEKI